MLPEVWVRPQNTHSGTDKGEHDPFVQGQRFSLLHLYPFLIQALHRIPAKNGLAEKGGLTEIPCKAAPNSSPCSGAEAGEEAAP